MHTAKIPKKEYLRIKVIPKSSRNAIVETFIDASGEETIKIKITAAPEKGKANAALIKLLSKELNISKSQISILSGQTSQIKLIKIKQ